MNSPGSSTPEDNPVIRVDLADYQLVARSAGTSAGSLLGVGGLPAQRTFLRFNVPQRLVDSTTIVRATLILTQIPTASVDARIADDVSAGRSRGASSCRTSARSAGILNPPSLEIDSLRVRPNERRVSEPFEIVGALRDVAGARPDDAAARDRPSVRRRKAHRRQSVLFYSSKAAPALRPRLRITYVNKVDFGIP